MAAENKPEGLKKIRNPERMVRIAVGYTGHAPPKSDDTDANNEPGQLKIYLPKKLLECLPKCSSLPKERHRWNTNEEIAAYLITFEKHDEWLTTSPKTRPQNGSMILYNRKKVKYRKDGYCWKKRKDGKTTREDHMKLKVQGVEDPPKQASKQQAECRAGDRNEPSSEMSRGREGGWGEAGSRREKHNPGWRASSYRMEIYGNALCLWQGTL